MRNSEWMAVLPSLVTRLRIIIVAMVMGCLFFAGIATYLALSRQAAAQPGEILVSYIALGVGILAMIARAFVPPLVVILGRRKVLDSAPDSAPTDPTFAAAGDAGRLWMVYTARTIVGAALLEGAAFLQIVAFVVENWVVSLVFAGVLVCLILADFPTESRLTDWTETQLRWLREQR